jgi:hypothetical protein
MQSVLDVVILTAAAHGWPLSSFSRDDMVAAVASDGYDAAVVAHCLGVFGAPARAEGAAGAEAEEGGAAWRLDAGAVCLARARAMLAHTPRWRLEEFMTAWGAAVPEVRVRRLACVRESRCHAVLPRASLTIRTHRSAPRAGHGAGGEHAARRSAHGDARRVSHSFAL